MYMAKNSFWQRILELIYGKKFGLTEAKLVVERLQSGKKVDIETLRMTLQVLGVEDTVQEDIKREIELLNNEIAQNTAANARIEASEKLAADKLAAEIKALEEVRAKAKAEADEIVEINNKDIAEIQGEIKETETLAKIFG